VYTVNTDYDSSSVVYASSSETFPTSSGEYTVTTEYSSSGGGGGVHAGYAVVPEYIPDTHLYSSGEYKTILQLVGVLSHGKTAKMLADRAIDLMQDVQNLRKAIYPYVAVLSSIFPSLNRKRSFKLKLDTMPKGTEQYRKLSTTAVNYLCVHLRSDPRQSN
jgi:hypothetical protein